MELYAKEVLGPSVQHELTCRAAMEDMGDTPVMTALSDNGMNKPTSRYVPSPQVQRRQNNAETCHVRQTR